jgi:hypothetical protein
VIQLDKKVISSIPIKFEQIQEIDDRFRRYKIWVVNVGKNYNGSIFTKEAIEKAIPSIVNTPVLGFIKENKLGEKDFAGHEYELVVKNGEIKERYLGNAYGVIPQDCNPQFELRENELGGLEEYLTVECIMWSKFDDAIEIMERDGDKKYHSMELHSDYSGYFNDEGYFVFEDFKFFGCCILGGDSLPAIPESTIEKIFSKYENINQKINEKMSEYRHILEKHLHSKKEVEHSMTLEELLEKYNISEQDLSEKGIDANEFSVEELEEKIKELFSSNEDEKVEDNNQQTSTQMEKEEEEDSQEDEKQEEQQPSQEFDNGDGNADVELPEEKFTVKFELSHDDIRRKILEQIDTHMSNKGFGETWYWIVSVFDNHVVVENDMGSKFYKVDYQKENDNISLGDVVEVFPMFLTAEEKGALELMRSNFEKLEQENEELKKFKADVLKAEHEAKAEELFAQFSKLTDEDIADLREKVHEFSIEELEGKLYERLGRKMANFSVKPKETSARLRIVQDEDNQTGSYSHIFAKYGIKSK